MTRKAIITWLTGICRVGEDCEKYGDPYDIAFNLQWLDDGLYEMTGVDKPLTREDRVAFIDAFHNAGVKHLKTRRVNKDGQSRSKTIDVESVHNNQREDKDN